MGSDLQGSNKVPVTARTIKAFMPGDHLATLRLGYMRHGICIGCGQVVSLSLKGFKQQSVRGFASTHDVWAIPLPDWHLPRDEIVARAMSARNSPAWRNYNLVTCNCESFTNWCMGGPGFSDQVVDGLTRLAQGKSPLDEQALGAYRREKESEVRDPLDRRHLVGNLMGITGNKMLELIGDAIDDLIH